jgi:hypothetical protein
MPVDLSAAGLPGAYPSQGPRLVPWLAIWALCGGMGAAVALLLWPAGTPARGAWFWFCVAGMPNALFFGLLGIARAGYEAAYLHALYRNQHRQAWLSQRVSYAQRPLQVLGVGYCLPLGGKGLSESLAGTTLLIKAQAPRRGSGTIVHGRFGDDDPLFAPVDEAAEDDSLPPAGEAAGAAAPPCEDISPLVRMIAQTLAPLTDNLHALSQYGETYAPAVRVLVSAEATDIRVQQVRHALRIAGLPAFECHAAPAADGLLLADAWLDAREKRPLLVIAAEWHDTPPVGSTEGGVAVLLGPGVFQLPEPVRVLANLHRPVAGELAALADVLANAVLWGKADAPAVNPAWISGLDTGHDTALLVALGTASLTGVTKPDMQHRPDRVVGHAGAAGGWLSIAAAVESGTAGPHLILNHTQTAQAAILYVNPLPQHDESDE